MSQDETIYPEVPQKCDGHGHCFRIGYRAARWMNGEYRVNLEAMRYEPTLPLSEPEFAAWTEGFRAGYLDRREAGEPTA